MSKERKTIAQKLAEAATIRRVGYDGEEVVVNYAVSASEETHTMRCKQAPTGAFRAALDAVKPHVAVILDLSAAKSAKWLDKVRVMAVTLRENADTVTAAITATHTRVEGKGSRFRLPALILDSDERGDDAHTEEAAAAIKEIVAEARAYLAGERSQPMITGMEVDDDED